MALPESLLRNMKKFQEPNGLPVHLKGGPRDRVLFGFTVACCAIGVLSSVHLYYSMGWKKKSG